MRNLMDGQEQIVVGCTANKVGNGKVFEGEGMGISEIYRKIGREKV